MELLPGAVLFSSRESQIRKSEADKRGLVPLARGAYLRLSHVNRTVKPWEARTLITQARILTLDRVIVGPRPVFTAEAAMVILGVSTWWSNPDILYRREAISQPKTVLPAVTVHACRVPSVNARRTDSAQPPNLVPEATSGVLTAPLGLVALDASRTTHPLQAYYDCSMLLRHASRFDRFDPDSRSRAETFRDAWLTFAEQLPHSRGVRQARAVLHVADPGLESPGEAIVAWCLRAILPAHESISTQHEVRTSAGQFFIDVALLRHRVAFEAAGYGKFGGSGDSGRAVGQRLLSRQQALADQGWQTINVTYEETRRIESLSGTLRKRLAGLGVATHSPAGRLWSPPTSLLQDRTRRF
ncbi:MAG: hypothetical protein WAS54_04605 [Scrofimicrobium sp.]